MGTVQEDLLVSRSAEGVALPPWRVMPLIDPRQSRLRSLVAALLCLPLVAVPLGLGLVAAEAVPGSPLLNELSRDPELLIDLLLGCVVLAGGLIMLGGHASRELQLQQQALLAAVAAHEQARDAAYARRDRLLRQVLPARVTETLLTRPGPIAELHDPVTVLFADVVGFCGLASRWDPEWVVDLLNRLFSQLDAISERHGLEKIKTIGDAYMAAAGLPGTNPDHAWATVQAAREMLGAARALRMIPGGVELRIGIHTGPVVAGVIGEARPAFDLWGDTVNVASRMESLGRAGRIHVTEPTRALLGDTVPVIDGGTFAAPGGPRLRTWLLDLDPLPARTT